MKLCWFSNAPFTFSAYGLQTALFVPRLAALGHEIVIASPHSFAGSPLDWQGFRVIPSAGDSYGNDIIAANVRYYGADLLITLCDVFKLVPSAPELAKIPVAHWIPIDCDPASEADIAVLRDGQGIPIAMSRFGERVLRKDGLSPYFVPHGVDPDVFKPGLREEVRASLGFTDDTFAIGVCSMNRDPVRKGIAEQVMAFAAFHEAHPQSRLMLHMQPRADPGVHVEALVRRLGFGPGIVMFPDSYSLATGLIGNEAMAAWYSGLDVLSACSYGEGFCVPLLEAQACGVPVVTTDFSAMAELVGAGMTVKGERYWVNGHASWWSRPRVPGITAAYEAMWQARRDGKMPELAQRARAFALTYDADRVTQEFWEPCLKQIEADLREG